MDGIVSVGMIVYEVDMDIVGIFQGCWDIDVVLNGFNGSMGCFEVGLNCIE